MTPWLVVALGSGYVGAMLGFVKRERDNMRMPRHPNPLLAQTMRDNRTNLWLVTAAVLMSPAWPYFAARDWWSERQERRRR